MKVKDETMVQFYQKIGQVYYKIAFSDGKVRDEEINTLKSLVSDSWVNLEDAEDEFGSDAAIQIEAVFDAMLDNRSTGSNAFENIRQFKDLHKHLFTENIRKQVYDTAVRIAQSFHGVNHEEKEDLRELKKVLYH